MAQLHGPRMTMSVRDGVAMSESPFLSTRGCQQIGMSGVQSFFAILEPLCVHPETSELASLVLDRLEQELATRSKLTATAAISASIEAVNEELHHYNQHRAEQDRLFYGLTCGISRGEDLYLAQVAPSQVLIGQDEELYAFPGLEFWHWTRRDDASTSLEQPLGMHGEIEPDLYHTRIVPGDMVVLCSGSLARVIQREPHDVFLQGDAALAMDHLRELADAYNVDNATCAAIAVTAQSKPKSKGHDFQFLRRVSLLAASFLPEETAERLRNRTAPSTETLDPEADPVHTADDQATTVDDELYWPDTIPADSEASDDHEDADLAFWETTSQWEVERESEYHYWDPQEGDEDFSDIDADLEADDDQGREGKRTLTEILVGAILALSAAVVGVWQLAVNRDRPMDGPREDEDTFGLPRLQRYDNSIQGPDFTGVRRRLPRAPISRFTGFVSIGLIFAVAIGLVYSITTSREQERTEAFEALVERATTARESALQSSDPVVAQSFLQASDARLSEAAELGVNEEIVLAEHAANAEARDAALGIERLGNIQALGGVPAAPEGVEPSLFFGNGKLYVFTDALYQLDAEESQLIRLIGEGDVINGQTVGELQGAAWGHGTPIAMDGSNLYVYDASSASWAHHELGSFGDSYSGIADISGYIGNLYLLSPNAGQIIRYHGDQLGAAPEDWASSDAAEQLTAGVDMVVDGRIYVLTENGEVLDFYRGALDETVSVNATPPIENAVSLSYQSDRDHMYIADERDRIVRATTEGEVVQQFMSGDDTPEMTNIQSIAVDDAIGTAYVLADSTLLQMRLPGPPR